MTEKRRHDWSDLLKYCPASGALQWRSRSIDDFKSQRAFYIWHSQRAGRIAGTVWQGRRIITFGGKRYPAGRVIWEIYYGVKPSGVIDHLNGNALDNRICNLRDTTYRENSRNQKTPKSNTSGVIGVRWCKQRKKWKAHIGQSIHLGYFESFNDAVLARYTAERDRGYHENHGRRA